MRSSWLKANGSRLDMISAIPEIGSSRPPFAFFSSFLRLVPLVNNLQGLPYLPDTSRIGASSDQIKSRGKVKESTGAPTAFSNELYWKSVSVNENGSRCYQPMILRLLHRGFRDALFRVDSARGFDT